MATRQHEPVTYDRHKGFWSRGANYNCPQGYYPACTNSVFPSPTEIEQRPGIREFLDTASLPGVVRRFWTYRPNPITVFYLILDRTNGKLYKHTDLVTPILTVAGMVDVSINVVFGRCYITPHDLSFGIINEFLYVWDGVAVTARKAAGVRPQNATPIAVVDTLAGKIEIGDHIFGVVYETDTGFITQPGPYNGTTPNYTLWAAPTGTGTGFTPNRNASLSSIPVGPAGTLKKHIVATKVIFNFNGNPEGSEFFFVPNGDMLNAVTTKVVDFFDSDLIRSADYLFDQMPEIPAGVALSNYNGRQVIAGPSGWTMANNVVVNGRQAWFSRANDPESFDAVGNPVQNDDTSGGGFKNGAALRDAFFLFCEGRTYQTRDNGLTPSEWPLDLVDGGYGAFPNTVAPVATVKGGQIDYLVIGNRSGCFAFNGAFQQPALSYVIEKYWNDVTIDDSFGVAVVRTLTMVIDPDDRILYITSNDLDRSILTMDFKDGVSADTVKWSPWLIQRNINGTNSVNITHVICDVRPSTQRQVPMFMFSTNGLGGSNRIGFLNPTATSDLIGTAAGVNEASVIKVRWKFAYTPQNRDSSIQHSAGIRYYAALILGGALLQPIYINVYDIRDGNLIPNNVTSINIGAALVSQWQSLNVKAERFSVELNYDPPGAFSNFERFRLHNLVIFMKDSDGSLPMQGV